MRISNILLFTIRMGRRMPITIIYQQRWNTHDHDDVPLVRDMLGEVRDEKLKQELF